MDTRNSQSNQNPSTNKKPKVVMVMGPTGSGKSKLAIDLASYFPIEVINADSMQVYKGLDVLTNKVPLDEQNGVPHHLLGTISPSIEFTSKDFRDSAIKMIDDILSRNQLPVIVGGTNYYIQALVTPFLLDDLVEEMDDCCLKDSIGNRGPEYKYESGNEESHVDYVCLKQLDPDAAKRLHPNDFRKINQYLDLYTRSGVPPSKIFQDRASKKWGRAENFRYDCCFISLDASLPVLDQYVEKRVDCMINTGLLTEVYDIYHQNANYTRGLRQAIGVREFEDFLRVCLEDKIPSANLKLMLESDDSQHKALLIEAVDKLKMNTKRLVRRQRRRLNRLQELFGWDLHYMDATNSLLENLISGNSSDPWTRGIVEPSVELIRSFLNDDCFVTNNGAVSQTMDTRDLWTQHVCEPCGNRILRGAHEWKCHIQGRGHRKRISGLKKSKQFLVEREAAATLGS